jgi:hypothetical protein
MQHERDMAEVDLPAALVCRSFAQHATTMFFPHFVGRCSKLPHLSSTTLKLSHLQSRPVGVPRQGSWPRPVPVAPIP